jgi:hypothetical protein
MEAWLRIAQALDRSELPADRQLAAGISRFVRESPFFREEMQRRSREVGTARSGRPDLERSRAMAIHRPGPEITR